MPPSETFFRFLRSKKPKRYEKVSGGYRAMTGGTDINKILLDLGPDPKWITSLKNGDFEEEPA